MYKEYTIKEFLNKEFLQYSNYKVVQQLPEFHDTLSQTQRKEIWVLSELPENKKIKTTDIYSLIYNKTNYLHGDASAYNVFENMAAQFKNNLNIIEAKANFGYRTNPHAAAARYASAQYSKFARKLFKDIDKNILNKQYLEGKEIEPQFLLPILPINVINGSSGIAVGFSSNLIPRDPQDLFNLIYDILKGNAKKLRIPKPKFPFFKGKIYFDKDNYNKIYIEGLIHKDKATKKTGILEITEVPYGYDREKMISILQKLEEEGKVISFDENCAKNDFYFKIKVPIEVYELTEKELIDLFKLKISMTENPTFLKYEENGDKCVVEYDNIAAYLGNWIVERLKWYQKRKDYILDTLKKDIDILNNKIKFIQMVIKDQIAINNKKKPEIVIQLDRFNFLKIDNKYDYLLSMPIWNLTQEKIIEMVNKLNKLVDEYKRIEKLEPKDLWIQDLDEIKEFVFS